MEMRKRKYDNVEVRGGNNVQKSMDERKTEEVEDDLMKERLDLDGSTAKGVQWKGTAEGAVDENGNGGMRVNEERTGEIAKDTGDDRRMGEMLKRNRNGEMDERVEESVLWEQSFCHRIGRPDSPAYISRGDELHHPHDKMNSFSDKVACSESPSLSPDSVAETSLKRRWPRVEERRPTRTTALSINQRLNLSKEKQLAKNFKSKTIGDAKLRTSRGSISSTPSASESASSSSSSSSSTGVCYWRQVFQRASHLDANWRLGRYVNVGVTSMTGGANCPIASLAIVTNPQQFVVDDVVQDVDRDGRNVYNIVDEVDGDDEDNVDGCGGNDDGDILGLGNDCGHGNRDGRNVVATACQDGFVRLWNMRGLTSRACIGFGASGRRRAVSYDSEDNEDGIDFNVMDASSSSSSSSNTRVTPTMIKTISTQRDVALVGCDDGKLRIISTLGRTGEADKQSAFHTQHLDTSQNHFGVLFTSISAHGDAMTNLEVAAISPSLSASFSSSSSSASSSCLLHSLNKHSSGPIPWTLAISVSADRSVFGWQIIHNSIRLLWAKRGEEHDDEVECCALSVNDDSVNEDSSPKGLFVTGSWDGRLVVRNAFTGDILHVLCGHLEAINSLRVVIDNDLIVNGGCSGGCGGNGAGCDDYSGNGGYGRRPGCNRGDMVCLSRDRDHDNAPTRGCHGFVIISGSADGSVMIWDGETGVGTNLLDLVHSAEIYCLAADKRWIVSGGADSNIAVWTFPDGVLKHFLTPASAMASSQRGGRSEGRGGGGGGGSSGHVGIVRCLSLGAEDRLVSAGDCRRILVWNVRSGTLLHQIHRQPILVKEMIFDERFVVTSSPESRGVVAVIAYW